MDAESVRIAAETARWTYWSMIAASFSATSAFATAIIAFLASRTWRKQERLNQLVRLKRTAFEYRTMVEKAGRIKQYGFEFREYLNSDLSDARGKVFHELALAGMDHQGCEQGRLYDQLFTLQELYKEKEASWADLLKAAVALQESIKVKIT
ncbi:hypothetical protein LWU33_20445 [Enterobacter hormaechei]|uniref:hypothetical protein n=1 Tax=Enterobacter hormaechei TaxID=158836 RepID=UPI00350FE0DE|nr:hypothetical protein [Enterobacter hormaechei]MCE1552323.1 hypothetical protein [Enterobacter hormaechei]